MRQSWKTTNREQKLWGIARRIGIYYAQAAAVAVVIYGMLLLFRDMSKVTFPEWLLVMFCASTVGVIPYFIELVRKGK